jgi:chemotaxis protein CheZ
MAEPRKVFRIEETAAARLARRIDGAQASLRHTEIMQALMTLRAAMAAPASQAANGHAALGAATERLASELNLIAGAIAGPEDDDDGNDGAELDAAHLTRISHELTAVASGTEQATQKILAATEEIDQLANNLSAALKGKIEQGLAQDISDLVIRIFEACNFQDLIGQRVAKVMAAIQFVEDHIGRVLDEIKNAPPAKSSGGAVQYLHGPRLDTDSGHVSQAEIDAMFDS